ncbi:MAG: DUF362 domain-containing protein [Candidatus Omnitrophica bacterium]|nr:DUF362 domain-containing protein [Candidatus Omnitrophota bacterium]
MKSRVVIIDEMNPEKAVTKALEEMEGLDGLFRGKHVAVKPNDTWASDDDNSACTRPDTLKGALRHIKHFNPRKITVTGGAGAGQTDKIFSLLGLDKVIREEDVEFFDHNRGPFREVSLDHGPQKSVMVNPYVLEYDTVVSLAQHKVHDSAVVTLGLKNIAMSYPAADYYGHPRNKKEHPHNFFRDLHSFIAGMCARFTIDLGIISGFPAMTGKGPIGGNAFDSGLVIASTDPVACDRIGSEVLGRGEAPYVRIAGELGLGRWELGDIDCYPLTLDEAKDIFTSRQSAS